METKTERQKLNRIKAVLAETGHTWQVACRAIRQRLRHRLQMVHQYLPTGFIYP